jgi:hypothetical protein
MKQQDARIITDDELGWIHLEEEILNLPTMFNLRCFFSNFDYTASNERVTGEW